MQFIGKDKERWDDLQRYGRTKEYIKKHNSEVKKDWMEICLRWFIIICVLAIYHLIVGALAIHIYN